MAIGSTESETGSFDLLARAQAGGVNELGRLIRRYAPRIRRILRARLSADAGAYIDIDDVVQETLVAAVRQLPAFSPKNDASILQWLAAIAVNKLRDQLDYLRAQRRDARRDIPIDDVSSVHLMAYVTDQTPSGAAHGRELQALLDAAVRRLPDDQRQAVILRDYCGMSWDEVANHLQRPSAHAAAQLHQRAWMSLRRSLGPSLREMDSGTVLTTAQTRWVARDMIGHAIGPYTPIEVVSETGRAAVFRAQSTKSRDEVGIKLVHQSMADNANLVTRLRREIELSSILLSDGVVPLFDSGRGATYEYCVMPYYRRGNLGRVIAARKQVILESSGTQRGGAGAWHDSVANELEYYRLIVACVAQMSRALAVVHRQHVLHCDLKPSNILFSESGAPLLADFGYARYMNNSADLSLARLRGTPQYMSPERTVESGAPLGITSDLFSLGVILYEALALRRPFEHPNTSGVFRSIQSSTPEPLNSINAAIPLCLSELTDMLLAKDPGGRPDCAERVADRLERMLL